MPDRAVMGTNTKIITYELLYAGVYEVYAIRCLVCGMVSYHPSDVKNRYCASCHRFHEEWPCGAY